MSTWHEHSLSSKSDHFTANCACWRLQFKTCLFAMFLLDVNLRQFFNCWFFCLIILLVIGCFLFRHLTSHFKHLICSEILIKIAHECILIYTWITKEASKISKETLHHGLKPNSIFKIIPSKRNVYSYKSIGIIFRWTWNEKTKISPWGSSRTECKWRHRPSPRLINIGKLWRLLCSWILSCLLRRDLLLLRAWLLSSRLGSDRRGNTHVFSCYMCLWWPMIYLFSSLWGFSWISFIQMSSWNIIRWWSLVARRRSRRNIGLRLP